MIFQQFNLVGRLDVPTHILMGRLNHTPTLSAVLQLWSDEDEAFTFTARAVRHRQPRRASRLTRDLPRIDSIIWPGRLKPSIVRTGEQASAAP
jgi:hypothetical protein